MKSLFESWAEFEDANREEFQKAVRLTVATSYPWLTSELFGIEGELGWGPGFREDFDGDTLFPSPTESSEKQMANFLKTLEQTEPDESFRQGISDAVQGVESKQKFARIMSAFLEKIRQRTRTESGVIYDVYRVFLSQRKDPYAIGGARIYRDLGKSNFLISLGGLLKLYCEPLKKTQVGALTVQRKFTRRLKTGVDLFVPINNSLVLEEAVS